MTTQQKTPTILTAEDARRLTGQIRDALAIADDLLVRAFEGRAWQALGHDSFADYVAAELPELRLIKLRTPVRRERASKLLEAGASVREIAAATGASVGTAHADVTALRPPERSELNTPAPLSPAIVEEMTRWQQVLRHVHAAGGRGLTCLEFEAATGLGHGAASGAFDAAKRKGYVRLDGRFRERYGVYVVSRP